MARLYISAAHKSSGKTTLSTGLVAALTARGTCVQPFKKGPDYIDPLWLGRASGRPCYNIDFNTQSVDEIRTVLSAHSQGADITLIEGNKGLHDGMALDGSNSNAAMAKVCDAPVVLVISCDGITRGVAPLLLGMQAFDPDVTIGGVILNMVASSRHEGKLVNVIEQYTDIPVLGAVHKNPMMSLTERHLGLMPANEDPAADDKIDLLAQVVAANVDLDRVMAVANTAPDLPQAAPIAVAPAADLTITYAKDAAFGFYYPDDLDAFAQAGAKMVPVDMINDTALPDNIDGLFIGGGFPETQMSALEANVSMRGSVKRAIEAGLPTYAECGGLMYLTRSLSWDGNNHAMCGVIPADTAMHAKPQGRGLVKLKENNNFPWDVSGLDVIQAHEFHYSSLENFEKPPIYAYDMARGSGIDGHHDGVVMHNLLANYAHMRSIEANSWVPRFTTFVRRCKAPST